MMRNARTTLSRTGMFSRFGVFFVLSLVAGGFLAAALAGLDPTEFLRFRVDDLLDQPVLDIDEVDTAGVDAIALADVDNDDRVDLIAVDYDAQAVSVRLGMGDGTFGDVAFSPAEDLDGSRFQPVGLTPADFTGPFSSNGGAPDGRPDVAVIGDGGEVFVLIGNGDGTFSVPDQEVDDDFEVAFPIAIASGNFDENSAADLVITEEDRLIVFCNEGGTIELCPDGVIDLRDQSSSDEGPLVYDSVVGDFNGDGHDDIAALSPIESTVYVAFGNGDGTFSFDIPVFVGESDERGAIAVGRMNEDDIDDLVVVTPSAFGDNAAVVLGRPNRLLQVLPFAGPETTMSIAVAPFDRDDLADILFSDMSNLFVESGNGTGDFSSSFGAIGATELGEARHRINRAASLQWADLNGDERLDVVGLVSEGQQIAVGINVIDQPTQTATATATPTFADTEAPAPTDTPTTLPPVSTPTQGETPISTPVDTRPPLSLDDDGCAVAPVQSSLPGVGPLALGLAILAVLRTRYRPYGKQQ